MNITQSLWPISTLLERKPLINLNPTWQRGPAWQDPRKVLLVDSILRGMDIPKLYLRSLGGGGGHAYDAVDGQQRLRAIWDFAEGHLALRHPEALPEIDGHAVAGRTYEQLDATLRERFLSFEVCIAEITQGDNGETTNLFSRLQMGVPLNAAELRNAVLSPMRHTIDAIATSHVFFTESRIPGKRYKRQDFAAHVFAMAIHAGARDIKAPVLKAMTRDNGPEQVDQILRWANEVGDALNVLAEVNRATDFRITQKWIFVDLCWMVMQLQAASMSIDSDKLAVAYLGFEARRRRYTSNPARLLEERDDGDALDTRLYEYIVAFRTEGATRTNLAIRNRALKAFCSDIEAVRR